MFDTLRSDYKRHGCRILNPPYWAICNYRYGNWASKIRFSPFRWLASKVYGLNQFIILITSNIQLHRETRIGKDLHLIHSGNILIAPHAVIGDRCGIMHDVTIGTNALPGTKIGLVVRHGAPTIGNDVFIGVGAKVLGGITIGDRVIIAANSLVTTDIPSGRIAIGVPARVIKPRNRPPAT